MTMAQWMRSFVLSHPEYKQDSVVSERINYDLMMRCCEISAGEPCEELLSDYNTKSKDHIPELVEKADNYLSKKTSQHSNSTQK